MTLEQQLRASEAMGYLERRIVAPYDGEPRIDQPAAIAIGAVVAALKALNNEQIASMIEAGGDGDRGAQGIPRGPGRLGPSPQLFKEV